jgi:hypothetical protein
LTPTAFTGGWLIAHVVSVTHSVASSEWSPDRLAFAAVFWGAILVAHLFVLHRLVRRWPAPAEIGPTRTERLWTGAVLVTLVVLSLAAAELLFPAEPEHAPLQPLGRARDGGRVDMPGSGFSLTVPVGWTVETAWPEPDIRTAEAGMAWEAVRAHDAAARQTCSVHVAIALEGQHLSEHGTSVGSGHATSDPHWDRGAQDPTLRIPDPRFRLEGPLPSASIETRERSAALDSTITRDVLYVLACGADEPNALPRLDGLELLALGSSPG